MGSFVARKVYELAPDRVSRLVLTGAGPAMQTPGMPDFMAAVEGLSDPVDEAFAVSSR